MADIYLLGHGAWDTIGNGAPYCTVPQGTSVVFYTPVGRFISSSQSAAIMLNSAGKLAPDRVVGEFKQCLNLTLEDGVFDDEIKALLSAGVRFVRVRQPTPLADLLKTYTGNRLHWLACQPRLGGRDTTEGGHNDDYFPTRGIGV